MLAYIAAMFSTLSYFRILVATASIIGMGAGALAYWQAGRHVVVFGDSIVRGLNSEHLGHPVINMSVSGTQTPQIAQVVSNFASMTGWRGVNRVIVEGGVNDLLNRSNSTTSSYEQILTLIPNQIPITMIGIIRVDEDKTPLRNSEIEAINSSLGKLCAARGNCLFVSPQIDVSELYDGLHPSQDGLALIGRSLR